MSQVRALPREPTLASVRTARILPLLLRSRPAALVLLTWSGLTRPKRRHPGRVRIGTAKDAIGPKVPPSRPSECPGRRCRSGPQRPLPAKAHASVTRRLPRSGRSGTCSLKTAPGLPSSTSSSVPPWARAIAELNARPSPAPPSSGERALSDLANRVKSRS